MLVRLFIALAFLAAAGSLLAGERAPIVDEPYELALEDFKAERIRESSKQLKLILANDKGHKKAAMLLGTIYYQSEKLERARGFFERTDPSAFSVETSFAYGATYMEFGEFKKAIPGFRHAVKAKGPYREYAIYYLGVIYYKLGQWGRARRFFQTVEAQELPVFLRVNRRRYLSDIRRKQDKVLNTIISSNDRSGSDFDASAPSEEPFALPQPKGLDPDSATDSGEAQVASPWRGSWRPSLLMTQQSSDFDNHGITNDALSIFAHRESLSGSLAYSSSQEKAKLSGLLQLTLGHSSYEARVRKTQYFKLDQTTGAFTSQSNRRPSESGGFGELKSSLSLGLSDEWRIEGAAEFLIELPGNSSAQSWGQGNVRGGLRYEGKDIEVGIEAAVLRPFDEGVRQDAQDMVFRSDIEKDLEVVRVSLSAYYWQTDRTAFISQNRFRYTLVDPSLRYRVGFKSELGTAGSTQFNFGELSLLLRAEYFDRQIEGNRYVNRISSLDDIETAVDGGSKFLMSVSYPIWDSFSLIGALGYNVLTAYLYSDRDEEGNLIQDYVTDIEQMTYQAGGQFSLTDWLQASGSYSFIANGYADKRVANTDFKRGNPDYVENSTFYLTITKSF